MANEKEEKKDRKKPFDLTAMFPGQVVLFLSAPFAKARQIPYKMAHSYLAATNRKLIWVSSDQPAEKVPDIFEDYGFDISDFLERVIFVDIVSAGAGVRERGESKVQAHIVENPNNMVELTMLLSDLFADEEVGLAVIDSVNGLLAFNSTEHVIQLFRFIPVIARRTNTTIMLNYIEGQYGPEMANALQITADASLVAEEDRLSIRMRTGTKEVPLQMEGPP